MADAFYVLFFPLCFLAFALLIRRGNRGSLVATSLDGLIAGLGVAALSAAFVVAEVIRVTGGGALAAATQLVYPLGDLLLFALAVGGLARACRGAFARSSPSPASPSRPMPSATGSTSSSPTSRFGYVANGVAWPISLTLLAVAVWILPARRGEPGVGPDRRASRCRPSAWRSAWASWSPRASCTSAGPPSRWPR